MSPEEKQKKLDEAIRLGFIEKYIDLDGIVRYVLTLRGKIQWIHETHHKRSH